MGKLKGKPTRKEEKIILWNDQWIHNYGLPTSQSNSGPIKHEKTLENWCVPSLCSCFPFCAESMNSHLRWQRRGGGGRGHHVVLPQVGKCPVLALLSGNSPLLPSSLLFQSSEDGSTGNLLNCFGKETSLSSATAFVVLPTSALLFWIK